MFSTLFGFLVGTFIKFCTRIFNVIFRTNFLQAIHSSHVSSGFFLYRFPKAFIYTSYRYGPFISLTVFPNDTVQYSQSKMSSYSH